TLAYGKEMKAGAALWQDDQSARASISNLDELSRTSADQLAATLGKDKAQALTGYLRTHPQALEQALSGIALARPRLAPSVQAYQADDRKDATRLALSAYLDGVEPVEPLLSARNSALRSQIELAMGAYRTSLTRNSSHASVRDQAEQVDRMLSEAQSLTENV